MSTTLPAEGMAAASAPPPADPLAEVAATLGLPLVDEKQQPPEGPSDDDQQQEDHNLEKPRLSPDDEEDTAALSRSQDASGERGGGGRVEMAQQHEEQDLLVPLHHQAAEEDDSLDFRDRDVPHHIYHDDQQHDGVSTITGVPTAEQNLYPSAFALLRADEEHQQRQHQHPMLQHSVQPLPNNNTSRNSSTNTTGTAVAASHASATEDKTIAKTLDGSLQGAGTAVFVSSSKRSATTTKDIKESGHSSRHSSSSAAAYQSLRALEDTVTSKLPNVGIGVAMVPTSQIAHIIREGEVVALQRSAAPIPPGLPGAFAVGGDLVLGMDNNNNNNNNSDRGAEDRNSESDEDNHPQIVLEDTATAQEEVSLSDNYEGEPSCRLAHARAVEEGQQSAPLLLPVAQPMDSSSKRTLNNKRTSYFLLAILVALVLVAVVVAATVNTGNKSSDDDDTGDTTGMQAAATKEEARRTAIYARIAAALDESNLASLPWGDDNDDNTLLGSPLSLSRMEYRASSHSNSQLLLKGDGTEADSSNPYARALQWILDTDPMQLNATAENLLQRYYLVLFYFSTTADQEWNFCNPPSGVNDTNPNCYYEVLKSSLHEALLWGTSVTEGGGYHWLNHWTDYVNYDEALAARWLSGQHECLWAGLFCDKQRATHLHLGNMNLTGTIPPEIDILEDMQSISIPYSQVQGPFPAGVAGLKNLTYLDLQENQLTGSAMDVLMSRGSLENLRLLNLGFNPLDTWSIPSDMAKVMPNLENFLCSVSSVTGSLPTELSELSNLRKCGGWLTNFVVQCWE